MDIRAILMGPWLLRDWVVGVHLGPIIVARASPLMGCQRYSYFRLLGVGTRAGALAQTMAADARAWRATSSSASCKRGLSGSETCGDANGCRRHWPRLFASTNAASGRLATWLFFCLSVGLGVIGGDIINGCTAFGGER